MFKDLLIQRIKECSHNYYWGNLDSLPAQYCNYDCYSAIIMFLRNIKWTTRAYFTHFDTEKQINALLSKYDIEGLEKTYQLLEDDYSKQTLIDVTALRMLGPQKVQMYLANPKYYEHYDEIAKLRVPNADPIKYIGWKLEQFKLTTRKSAYNVYSTYNSVFLDLYYQQYEYGNFVKAQPGDYVIDGGACFGNTALYFADLVQPGGRVYSFEFMKDCLEIFHKNLELNPNLKDSIEIITNSLWCDSSLDLFVIENGPATTVHVKQPQKYDMKVSSVAIDDLVETQKISKVDFLKLDIEGAELECLQGAEKTIKTFKPKLAICLYHKNEHFISIPQYLHEIVPEYRFYLKHHCLNEGETVLYAIAK